MKSREEKKAARAGARIMLAGQRLNADSEFLLRTMEADERLEELMDASDRGMLKLTDAIRELVPPQYRGAPQQKQQGGASGGWAARADEIRAEVAAEQAARRGHVPAAERLAKDGEAAARLDRHGPR